MTIAATNPTSATGGFAGTAFETFLKDRDQPPWLVDRRREAFARFEAAPLAYPPRRGMAEDRHPALQARLVRAAFAA